MQTDKRLNQILAFFVFLISTFVYLKTIAPTVSFWDCGEFITSAYILGVPHPPGAPFYLLVSRIFSMIPFAEDIALRVNVISALTSGLTIMFTYLIIVRLIIMFRGKIAEATDRIIVYGSGIIGSLSLAFSESFWFNSVEAEVYSISMFFTAFIIWLILVWYDKGDSPSGDKYILLIAYLVGLVIGVHLLSILVIPAIFLLVYFRKYGKFELQSFVIFSVVAGIIFAVIYPGIVKKLPNFFLFLSKKGGATLTTVFAIAFIGLLFYGIKTAVEDKKRYLFLTLACTLLILMGVSTYSAIYIRSNLNPKLDENDPENMANMVSYLNREQYGEWSIVKRRAPLWEYQIKKMYIRYFGWQFIGKGTTLDNDERIVETLSLNGLYMLPFLIGLLGMYYHFRKDWHHASFVMLLFLMTGLAIVIYLNQEDPQPRERDYVYVGSFMAFAFWIGIGASAIMDKIKELIPKAKPRLKLSAILAVGLVLLVASPINLLSFNYESHDRTGNYVAYDYSYNILQSCEPNAILFTNGDNDTFPLWFLQYVEGVRTDVRVVNLSLLNTHWYIKQLRDEEPIVPISLSDTQIDALQPMLWDKPKPIRIKVPKDAYLRDLEDVKEIKQLDEELETVPSIIFKLKPTLYGKGIRVQDLMILNIIQTNQFRKPIYFALTVSQDNLINLNEYLRMDGLVYKLVTYKGQELSPPHLKNNLLNKFRYRNLNRKDVYFNENIKGLLRNYQGAFFNLARFYNKEKMYTDMVEVIDKLFSVMPDTVIPMRHELAFQFALMYKNAGETEKASTLLNRIIRRNDTTLDAKLQYTLYFYRDDQKKAAEMAEKLHQQYPDYANNVYWLANYYMNQKQYEIGLTLVNSWLAKHPDDRTAIAFQQQFQRLLKPSMPDTTALNNARLDSQKAGKQAVEDFK